MQQLLPWSTCVFIICLVIRVSVGMWGYSGYQHPPMYGDYEAQRHWMEITTALRMEDWYRNTTHNDLLYWGLDYPPLTAYTSYAFGIVAHAVFPELVLLHESRGHESSTGKAFMRASVLLCDLVILIPAVVALCRVLIARKRCKSFEYESILAIVLLAPPLILIDHGHFQYNGVSIGLAFLGAVAILVDRDFAGSIFFSLSLNFKQMSLYYAPMFFFSLLRKCFLKSYTSSRMKSSLFPSLVHLILVGGTVILTFAALWTPFCAFLSGENTCTSTLLQIVHRLFPFSRGIFEDKVANIWYCLSVPFEFRHLVSTDHLVRASLGLTLLLLFPICVDLLRRPLTPSRALLALVNCSLSFFLASFQVHEKSLLLALVPASFLIPQSPLDAGWFQIVGGMTLYPLLKRDGQAVPYFCTLVFYCSLLFGIFDKHIGTLSTQVTKAHNKSSRKHWFELLQPFITYIRHMYFLVSVTGFFLLHFAELQISPPERYPDLYPALFSIFGCCNLLWYYTYFVSWQLSLKEKSE